MELVARRLEEEARVPRRRGSRDGRAGGGVRAGVNRAPRRGVSAPEPTVTHKSPPHSLVERRSRDSVWSPQPISPPRGHGGLSALKRRSIDRGLSRAWLSSVSKSEAISAPKATEHRTVSLGHPSVPVSVSKTTEHRCFATCESPAPKADESIDRDVREALIGAAACTSPSKSSRSIDSDGPSVVSAQK